MDEKPIFSEAYGLTRPSKWRWDIGDRVRKKSGSWWEGEICGFYSTQQTPRGYAIQQLVPGENGPVQIFPESALEDWPHDGP